MSEDIQRLKRLAEEFGTFEDIVAITNIEKELNSGEFKLRVGMKFYGFCNGYFGRDSHEDKTVESIGSDWLIVRNETGYPEIAYFRNGVENNLEMFQEWTVERKDE